MRRIILGDEGWGTGDGGPPPDHYPLISLQKCDQASSDGLGYGNEKGRREAPASPFPFPSSPLRRETPQRSTDIAFAETLERAIAKLADTLARDAKH